MNKSVNGVLVPMTPEEIAAREADEAAQIAGAAARAAERARKRALAEDPETIDLLMRLRTASPAQIDTWLTNNVTNLTEARTVLGMILKLIGSRL
jgi:hypothetical protein